MHGGGGKTDWNQHHILRSIQKHIELHKPHKGVWVIFWKCLDIGTVFPSPKIVRPNWRPRIFILWLMSKHNELEFRIHTCYVCQMTAKISKTKRYEAEHFEWPLLFSTTMKQYYTFKNVQNWFNKIKNQIELN